MTEWGWGMKKRTVITTEKREVWVIRTLVGTPAEKTNEHKADDEQAGSSDDPLIAPLNTDVETDEFPNEGS
jgi:hypothetical protein